MNNEIKEILDIFKQVDLEADVGGCSNCPRKDKNKTCVGCLNNAKDKLLDYITNLQEENKELKKKITFNEKSRRKMQQSLMEQIETNKSRNEKAIDYINNNKKKLYQGRNDFTCEIKYSDEVVKADELLDILQGEDKE